MCDLVLPDLRVKNDVECAMLFTFLLTAGGNPAARTLGRGVWSEGSLTSAKIQIYFGGSKIGSRWEKWMKKAGLTDEFLTNAYKQVNGILDIFNIK